MQNPESDPQRNARDPRSLFYLPDELLVQVVSHLAADRQTLCVLARTCRFFQIEAEKHVYTTIELLSTGDLHAIIEAFTRRPERIASVETLKILYRFHQGLGATLEQRDVFNQCVKRMKALRQWEIESPYDNYKWDEGGDEWVLGDMEEFRKALESASLHAQGTTMDVPFDVGLAKLESLTLHTHGVSDDFWDLGNFHCLFRHPSLRHLHVSCLALPPDLPELAPYAKSTPLTSLVFDECELEPKSLGRILATPKNLRHLTLGENVCNVNLSRRTNPRLTRNAEASLAALSHVAHSLESLTHYDPAWALDFNTHKHRALSGPGMRDFHSLTDLCVDACSFLHRSIALSHAQAPPNLHTLQIRHARPHVHRFGLAGTMSHADFFEHLPPHEPYTYLAALKTLEFVQGASLEMPMATPHHMCEKEFLRERHEVGYKLYKHGINLKVSLEATWRTGLIPPFLHGEPPPRILNVYDAGAAGFRRLRHGVGIVGGRGEGGAEGGEGGRGEEDGEGDAEEKGDGERGGGGGGGEGEGERGKQDTESSPDIETPHLSDADIHALTTEVHRKLNRLFNLMRSLAGDDDSDDDVAGFTVIIESDDGDADGDDDDDDLWGEIDDVDADDEEIWMDEDDVMGMEGHGYMYGGDQGDEEPHVGYVMGMQGFVPGGMQTGVPIEVQAQALLNAAYAVEMEMEMGEGEGEETDGVD